MLKVVNEIDINVEIELKDDLQSQKKYNIKNIPSLVINGNKCSEGYVPNTREITKFIKSYAAN